MASELGHSETRGTARKARERPCVLSIEDDPLVRSIVVRLLAERGFDMIEAGDGDAGLARFRQDEPDVVLCDLRLPGRDGHSVLASISAESPETPVIMVSGAGHIDDAVNALKAGAWDFITKPLGDIEVLERAVWRALEKVELARENRRHREHLEELNRELTRAVERFHEEEEAGRKLQSQLLPPDATRLGGCRFHRRLYPSASLSGDFVDFFPVGERHAGFYMADVAGHGAASAFVTVIVKTLMSQYIGAFAREGDPTLLHPCQTLQRLDRDLRAQRLDKHVTVFYGVIDARESTLTYSTGAQFPYPLLFDGAECKALDLRGRPVGLFDGYTFKSARLPLPSRFRLLLVSDGIIDHLARGAASAVVGHAQAVMQLALRDSGGDIEVITSMLGLGKTTELPDDVTVLLIARELDS